MQAALGKLRDGGYRHDEAMADSATRIRLDRRDGDQIATTVEALTKKFVGQWIIVGPFTIPGDKGAVMTRRREFNQGLKAVATRCNAKFFNPTKLIQFAAWQGRSARRRACRSMSTRGVVLPGHWAQALASADSARWRFDHEGGCLDPERRNSAPCATCCRGSPAQRSPWRRRKAKTASLARYLRRWARKIGRGLAKISAPGHRTTRLDPDPVERDRDPPSLRRHAGSGLPRRCSDPASRGVPARKCRRLVRRARPDTTIDSVAGWGFKPTARYARQLAARRGWPYLALEDGFLRSVGLGEAGAPPLSLIADDLGVYYDVRGPSRLETLLETGGWKGEALLARAREAIYASSTPAFRRPIPPLPCHRTPALPRGGAS